MSVTSAPASLIMRVSLPLSKPYVPPNNELEALAATTFAEVFNLDKVGIDDEFFELGGDSLLAEVLSLALSERTSVPLQPSAFVESASPREIARLFNGTDVGPGWLDIARYANSQWAKAPILQAWRTVLRHLPEAPADGFADDRSKDLQVAPAAEGRASRSQSPDRLCLLRPWAAFLAPPQYHPSLARIAWRPHCLPERLPKAVLPYGIASLGSDYATSIKGLRKLSADLGASSIHCHRQFGGCLRRHADGSGSGGSVGPLSRRDHRIHIAQEGIGIPSRCRRSPPVVRRRPCHAGLALPL